MAVYDTLGRCHLYTISPSILNLALFYDMGLVYDIERSEKITIRDIKALSSD